MGEVVIFPPRAPFRTFLEAITAARSWPFISPPVDASGDPAVDSYLVTIFNGICRMDSVAARLAHLREKADDNERRAEQIDRARTITTRPSADADYLRAADAHRLLARTLRKWATEIGDATYAGLPDDGDAA